MPSVPSPIRKLICSAERPGDDLVALGADVHRHRVEESLRVRRKAELAQTPPPAPRRGDARCARSPSAPPGHDRPRTSRRSPPAAPARCRCWRSPFRGGYAARGFAARGDRPARRANPPTARRCGRAVSASAHRAPPYRRHAGRHTPSARQSAAPIRSRCRRRVRRARPISVSASRSAATIASAPLACSAAIAGRRSRTAPECRRILQQRRRTPRRCRDR